MADNGNSEDKKKWWSTGKIGGIAGAEIFVVKAVLCFVDKAITPSQLIGFINNWPVVLLGLSACVSYVIVKCYTQKNKTIRDQNSLDDYKEQLKELKEKMKELEKELKQKNEQCSQITIEKGNLENKICYLEKEINRLEQIINGKGGEGGTNVIPFNGRNGSNT